MSQPMQYRPNGGLRRRFRPSAQGALGAVALVVVMGTMGATWAAMTSQGPHGSQAAAVEVVQRHCLGIQVWTAYTSAAQLYPEKAAAFEADIVRLQQADPDAGALLAAAVDAHRNASAVPYYANSVFGICDPSLSLQDYGIRSFLTPVVLIGQAAHDAAARSSTGR